MNKKIVMMGCGTEAERKYYEFINRDIEIEFFLDNKKDGFFHGKPIY